ncbi:uncharacterized protein K02A2.6-like [Cataglyphis hispanica]|uniref:uncharacterized protein K02A2.6-like n=1 Tax=Cataglyphis hispanica TaxID=1086592 RepID=UPI0021803460|nr:uncharacterized protein K02A2.6-like [Cataglyphis hispanica]
MRPEYKGYAKRRDIHDLSDLLEEAAEFEGIEQKARELRKTPKGIAVSPAVATTYSREECFLLAMREGRNPHQGLPPAAGKRQPCREHYGRLPGDQHGVKYTPRPHLTVTVHGLPIHALLDSGSELSFINAETVEKMQQRGFETTLAESQIQMVDGAHAMTRGHIRAPFRLQGCTYTHVFTILPSLREAMLIGVDLWSRLELNIAPPRRPHLQRRYPTCGMTNGLATRTTEEDERLRKFLGSELPKFQAVTGPTPVAEHQIRLKNQVPIKQRYRPRNPAMQAIIDAEVEEMERAGVIEPSRSAWNSPIVVVRKKDGKHRFCIDFQKVNEVTEKDAYPLPQVTATLDKLRRARYLTTLDLKNGYWQVPLAPESDHRVYRTGEGVDAVPGYALWLAFRARYLPTPARFSHRSRARAERIRISRRHHRHQSNIRAASRTAGRSFPPPPRRPTPLEPGKMPLLRGPAQIFRARRRPHRNPHGPGEGQRGSRAEPRSIKQIRQFLGMASWYRRFIKDFSILAAPLTRLTKKNTRWTWREDEATAFQQLKDALTTAPVFACPDFNRRFFLQTDASTSGLGAVLTQYREDGERVIAYASRTLTGAEKNYSATELECLAVVWGIRRMRNYLEGYAFTVITDHQSLRWLKKLETPTGRLARWLFELQQFDYDIKYRRGTLNRVADALSRQPETIPPKTSGRCASRAKEGRTSCASSATRPPPDTGGSPKRSPGSPNGATGPGCSATSPDTSDSCPGCLAHKPLQQKPAGTMHATNISRPWEHVTIDLVGPLPRSRRGHTWLLVMQDRYSKWAELAPLRQATAKAVTGEIINRVILRHGRPDIIITDNGTQFKSAPLAARLKAFNIEHRTAPVRALHCNPVERTNRTIKTMIAQYVDRDHREWDEALPAVQFAYNTAVHDVTGYTPAFVNHGRELTSPAPALPRNPETPTPDTVQRRLQEAEQVVRINLARSFQRQERYYNLRRRQWRPQVGDEVWKREHPLSNKANAFNAKLALKFIGSLEVRRMISPVIADLRSRSGKWYQHVHIQDLKPAPKDNNNNRTETSDDASDYSDGENNENNNKQDK